MTIEISTETPTNPAPSAPAVDVDSIKRAVAQELQTSLAKQYDEKLSQAVTELKTKQERAAAVLRGEDPDASAKQKSAFAKALEADPEKAMLGLLSSFETELEKKIINRQQENKENADIVNSVFAEVEAEYDIPKAAIKYFPTLLHTHFVTGGKPLKDAARAALNELIADYKVEKKVKPSEGGMPAGNGFFQKAGEKQSVADYIKMQNEKIKKTRKV